MQPKINLGQDLDDQELALQKSRAGLLTASTTDLWYQIILYCEAVLCIGGSLLAASMELCPQDASGTHPPKMRQPKRLQILSGVPGGQKHLIENHWARAKACLAGGTRLAACLASPVPAVPPSG